MTHGAIQRFQTKRSEKTMARFEDAAWILTSVILRKSISLFRELSHLLMDLVSILSSAIQFSGFIIRRPVAVSNMYPPMSIMVYRAWDSRYDYFWMIIMASFLLFAFYLVVLRCLVDFQHFIGCYKMMNTRTG